jgi:hypothetical protein
MCFEDYYGTSNEYHYDFLNTKILGIEQLENGLSYKVTLQITTWSKKRIHGFDTIEILVSPFDLQVIDFIHKDYENE